MFGNSDVNRSHMAPKARHLRLVGQSANLVAQRALDALKRSSRERSAHHISCPACAWGVGVVKDGMCVCLVLCGLLDSDSGALLLLLESCVVLCVASPQSPSQRALVRIR